MKRYYKTHNTRVNNMLVVEVWRNDVFIKKFTGNTAKKKAQSLIRKIEKQPPELTESHILYNWPEPKI